VISKLFSTEPWGYGCEILSFTVKEEHRFMVF